MHARRLTLIACLAAPIGAAEVHVADTTSLQSAIAAATPGTIIDVDPGTYGGNLYFANIQGTEAAHIVIRATDPTHKPLISGGSEGLHIDDAAWLEVRDLAFTGQGFQAINIADGGSYDTPAHDLLLHGIDVQHVGTDPGGAGGITNGIKLSGVDRFTVEDSLVDDWGAGAGDGIDMVGCHDGVIQRSTFRFADHSTSHAFQTKGGSHAITISHCRFEHTGERAFQLGGSTGFAYFRPSSAVGYEAKDIVAEYNVIIGSEASVAFVGVDHPVFRFNTVYCPTTWLMRILQETVAPGFVPCRNGEVTDNIFVFTSGLQTTINIGSNTAPETFAFARNWWYCLDNPGASAPTLPTTETDGHIGVDPRFVDAAGGDFHLASASPANIAGAYAIGGSATGSATAGGGFTGTGATSGGGATGGGSGGGGGGCGLGSGAALLLALLARRRQE